MWNALPASLRLVENCTRFRHFASLRTDEHEQNPDADSAEGSSAEQDARATSTLHRAESAFVLFLSWFVDDFEKPNLA